MSDISVYIKIFIAIMVLVNPLEGMSMFLSKTTGLDSNTRAKVIRKTSLTVFIVLVTSLFFGKYVLTLFGIGIASFTVAGGIIIFLIALEMILGNSDSSTQQVSADPGQSAMAIAVVPLGIPLLAGPGPISSVILYGSSSKGFVEDIILVFIILVVSIGVSLSLNAAAKMEKRLKNNGVNILTKISGILVSAIAIEMIYSGIVKMFPQLHQ
ncbi:MAG: NAAT family transporter [Ignavibacteria bacterium]